MTEYYQQKENKTLEQTYAEFVKYIFDHGKAHDKKHGNWIRLQYTNDLFFELDTWNHCITLKQGSGECDYHNGFEGQTIKCIGIDFGRFDCYINKELLEFYLDAVKI